MVEARHADTVPRLRRSVRGFTLIELVVVLALVGLLLTIAAPRYFGIIDRNRERVQHQNASVMRDAIDKYYGDLGHYPDTLEDLVSRHYLREIPIDPISEQRDWSVVAPADPSQGAVFDVLPHGAAEAASAAGAGA